MNNLPPRHQTLLFSATMPKEIEDLAKAYLTQPVTVKVRGACALKSHYGRGRRRDARGAALYLLRPMSWPATLTPAEGGGASQAGGGHRSLTDRCMPC